MNALDTSRYAGQRARRGTPPDRRPRQGDDGTGRPGPRLELLWVPLSLLAGLLLWQMVVALGHYPAFILPGPGRVAARFVAAVRDGTWWWHTQVTLVESLLGFALGFAVATPLGYVLAHRPFLERLAAPYIAASQALPVIAIAPLLLLWLGFGLLPKVLVAALVVFFPILVNTVTGLRGIDPSLREVALVYGASRWQTVRLVELPLALPTLLSGVKIGFTLAVTGATVAEFIGASRGLGLLLNISKGLFDTPLLFVALVTLIAMAIVAYGFVSLLERLLIRW
ncbi:MAG TPA: ABC transporter permease [Thermomicrobiales bacterium]|nr:ABC transporter permease [Thermomicrobiales bacterium]